MQFEWDEDKNKLNRAKHGVWFEDARLVFFDRQYKFYFDGSHSHEEDRYMAIGSSLDQRVLVVCHTYRENSIRIISARMATKKEEGFYYGRRIRLL